MPEMSLISRYNARVPRYTSYPTAPNFVSGFPGETYADWLDALQEDQPISLYVHVPFCDRLCLYCGCTTTVVRQEAPLLRYADLLIAELELIAFQIGRRARVSAVHWGGGTPTQLPASALIRIMGSIRRLFEVDSDAEIAIEIDPTSLAVDRLSALASMGITRASLGVQDLNPEVQAAIGRRQSYDQTARCADELRRLGIGSLNLDLIYGLPLQTEESVADTARRALGLRADRVAVFGYAHVPWMKRHQKLIQDSQLPGPRERFRQRRVISQVLEQDGYHPVGLDHFARPSDQLARSEQAGTLHRSFQGYTTDTAQVLLGIGASSIGTLPQGYVQNAPDVPGYAAAITQGRLATVRGIELSPDDMLRRAVIEQVMCHLAVDLDALAAAHCLPAEALHDSARALAPFEEDGLVRRRGTIIEVTEQGRPFVRNVAAVFDAYLAAPGAGLRHSAGV